MKKAHMVRFLVAQVEHVSAQNELGHVRGEPTMGDDHAADICHDEVAGVGGGSGGRSVVANPHAGHIEATYGGADIQ